MGVGEPSKVQKRGCGVKNSGRENQEGTTFGIQINKYI